MRSNFNTMINYEIFMTNYKVFENDLFFIIISLFTHKSNLQNDMILKYGTAGKFSVSDSWAPLRIFHQRLKTCTFIHECPLLMSYLWLINCLIFIMVIINDIWLYWIRDKWEAASKLQSNIREYACKLGIIKWISLTSLSAAAFNTLPDSPKRYFSGHIMGKISLYAIISCSLNYRKE